MKNITLECPVCGSLNVGYNNNKNEWEWYKCKACGHKGDVDQFHLISSKIDSTEKEEKSGYSVEQLSFNFEKDMERIVKPVDMSPFKKTVEFTFKFSPEKRKINRPHYKDLYEKEKIERAKLQAQFICLKMINETLSKDNHTEKINILLGCIDAISKYTTDWYIKNEIKRAREKISKIK